jgi:hypothetical protein
VWTWSVIFWSRASSTDFQRIEDNFYFRENTFPTHWKYSLRFFAILLAISPRKKNPKSLKQTKPAKQVPHYSNSKELAELPDYFGAENILKTRTVKGHQQYFVHVALVMIINIILGLMLIRLDIQEKKTPKKESRNRHQMSETPWPNSVLTYF